MFVDFFIKRPIFAAVCAIIITLAGLVSIPSLPIALYPDITSPKVTVTSVYNGANAEVVESAVTSILEQEINGVNGMKYITSLSANNGSSTIEVTFKLGTNIDIAAVDVQNRVNTASGRLPAEIKTTGVVIRKTAARIMAIGIYTDDNRYSKQFISNYMDRYIKDSIQRVRGVGEVDIFGQRKFSMRLWLDPNRLAMRGLTAGDVVKALQDQNVQVPAGQIGAPPLPAGQNYQMTVNVAGRLKDATEFGNITLKPGPDGALVKVKDVGRVELGSEDYSTVLRFNGHDAIGFTVTQLPGANALDVSNGVKAELGRLSKSFPPGLKFKDSFNSTVIVEESTKEVVWTLVEAILLVVAVIFIFLQNWRTTLIPVITIPVSLVGTFIFVKLLGFSLNSLTLFGITLATGLVVDDAIVVIENISRFVETHGMEPMQAASEAMKEVFSAVLATTLVLIAVFVPVAFLPGASGQLYQQFALTIAFSVAISAFNAFTLTPALSARLIKKDHAVLKNDLHGRFFTFVNRVIDGLRRGYARILKQVVIYRGFAFLAFLVLLAATVFLYQRVPTGFIPNEDQGYLIVTVQTPPGSSLDYTDRAMRKVEKALLQVKDFQGIFSIAGFSFTGPAPNKAIIFPNLKALKERTGSGPHNIDGIIGQLYGAFSQIPEASVFVFPPPAVQGVGAFGGVQFEILDKSGGDFTQLEQVTNQLVGKANGSNLMVGAFSAFTANDPVLAVTVDRDKAAALHVPISEISGALQVYLGSVYVNDFDILARVYRVYVQADQAYRSHPQDIDKLMVRADTGVMIPLSALVSVQEKTAPQVISHYNLFRSTEINSGTLPGYSTGQAIDKMQQLAKQVFPKGFDYEWSGLSLEELESGSQTFFIFALGIVFVFLILAAQYESFLDPLTIMMAVPLAIFGALVAQSLRGLQNDVFCQIGFFMLIGLSSKNAILIVEFANQLRKQGRSIVEAVTEAAEIRLRPILMTSLAFILGLAPLLIAEGSGSNSRHSLGTAVVGGMIASTVLSLLVIPVLYIYIAGLEEWIDRKRHPERYKPEHNPRL